MAEAVYTSSRGGGNNSRWDYWGSPNYGNSGNGFILMAILGAIHGIDGILLTT
jgi:hypothetical protein